VNVIFCLFGGCYEIGDLFGCGGMVEVYFGCDICFGCMVVIKMLCFDFVCDLLF